MKKRTSSKSGFPRVKGLVKKRTKNGHRYLLTSSDGAGKTRSVTVRVTDSSTVSEFMAAVENARLELEARTAAIGGAMAEFFASRRAGKSTQAVYRNALRGFSMNDRENAAAMTRLLASGKKSSSLWVYTTCVRTFFEWAIRNGAHVRNPADGVRVNARKEARTRVMSPEERDMLDRYIHRCDPAFRLFVLLLMHTGARLSTVASIRPQDLRDGMLTLYNVKARRFYEYRIPIRCTEILELWKHVGEFPGNGGRYKSRLNTWMRRNFKKDARGEALSAHSLRHTFATNAARNGVPIEVIAKLLDHQSIATTARFYARYSDSQIAAAVDLAVKKGAD